MNGPLSTKPCVPLTEGKKMATKPGDKDEPGTAVGDGTGHHGTLVPPLGGPEVGTRPYSWDHVFVGVSASARAG